MHDDTSLDLDDLYHEIQASMHKIPDGIADRVGSFAHFNKNGSQAPLFWCFNNWAEAVFLANRLGEDRPIFAMRSFHGFAKMKQIKRANTVDFAETYAEQLLRHVDSGPLLVGGNCQAAPIAEALAHILIRRTGRKPLLMTLENMPIYSYPGDILMMFGKMSQKYNPFLQGKDPLPGWRAQHTRPAWGLVNGGHGQYFREPAVFDLVSFIVQACKAHISGEGLTFAQMSPDVQMCPV